MVFDQEVIKNGTEKYTKIAPNNMVFENHKKVSFNIASEASYMLAAK